MVNKPLRKPRFPDPMFRHSLQHCILPIVEKVRGEDKRIHTHHPPNLETLLNIFLVWAGARKATLPAWKDLREDDILTFVHRLNQLPESTVANIIVTEFTQRYPSGNVTQQRIITPQDNQNVCFTKESLVTDADLGKQLGFYQPNVDHYAKYSLDSRPHSTFLVEECTFDTLLFAETFFPELLSPSQSKRFRKHCMKQVRWFNKAMKWFGWPYHFCGVFETGDSSVQITPAI
jgi:hypothetical protein